MRLSNCVISVINLVSVIGPKNVGFPENTSLKVSKLVCYGYNLPTLMLLLYIKRIRCVLWKVCDAVY